MGVSSSDLYYASSAMFDGVNDRIQFLGSSITFPIGKQFTFSTWIKPVVDGTTMYILQGRSGTSGPLWRINRNTGNGLTIIATNSASTTILNVSSPNDLITVARGWIHLCGSVDLTSTSRRFLYVNGINVSSSSVWSTYIDDSIAFDRTDLNIGVDDSNGGDLSGCLAEIWFKDSYIDLSYQINRQKFSWGGRPVKLGQNGDLGDGNIPQLYMKFQRELLGVNSGSLGGIGNLTGEVSYGGCGEVFYNL